MKAFGLLWIAAMKLRRKSSLVSFDFFIQHFNKLSFCLCADQEIIDTFDRAEYRQSGSSLDSNNDPKKKKNNKMFKGFGMFK